MNVYVLGFGHGLSAQVEQLFHICESFSQWFAFIRPVPQWLEEYGDQFFVGYLAGRVMSIVILLTIFLLLPGWMCGHSHSVSYEQRVKKQKAKVKRAEDKLTVQKEALNDIHVMA